MLQGKGYFLWQIPKCEGGDANAIANAAHQAGFTHALIKIANGTYGYNVTSAGVDLVPPVAQALRSRGIHVWGWHYLYGDDPVGEANKAIQRIQQTGMEGYVMDVEREYKDPGKSAAAVTFLDRMRAAFPNLPLALCSYRFPSYHPQVPWKEFLARSDINMPQVYWEQTHNPADQLQRTLDEFQSMTPIRPIIPVGAAYRTGSWAATPEDVTAFLQMAKNLNFSAANFWEWSNTRSFLPDVWSAIAEFSWSGAPAPQQDLAVQYIAALNKRDPNAVASLYTAAAIHINSARTVQGQPAIRAWYQSLFNQILPNATFTLVNYNGTGSSRHISWTATSSAGSVHNGSDTLGLLGGKIAYHYTFFSLTSSTRAHLARAR